MQVLALYLVDVCNQGVEVVGDGEVAAGETVAASSRELEDEVRGLARVGAVPGREPVTDPAG